MTMTQQDVAAAVAEIIRNHVQIGGTDWSRNAGAGDINAEEVSRLVLSALQQRSGAVERERVAQHLCDRFQRNPCGHHVPWDRMSDYGKENWLAEADRLYERAECGVAALKPTA